MINAKNRALLGTLAALAANLLFGFSNMFSKLALETAHPVFILTVRFTLAFLVLNILVLLKIGKLNLKGKNVLPAVLLGVFQPLLYMVFELYGIFLTSSAVSGVIISLSPVLVLFFSGVFLKERPSLLQGVFSLFSFGGVALTALFSNDRQNNYFLGILLLIAAALCAVAFNLLGRRLSLDFSPFERTYVTFGVSFVGFQLILPFVLRENFFSQALTAFSSAQFWLAITYLSVGSSIIAFLLYNFAVSNISAVRASSFSNIITVVSVLAGVLILKEHLSVIQIFGCILIIVGVWGVNRFKQEENYEFVKKKNHRP